jgi:hypothetical protein
VLRAGLRRRSAVDEGRPNSSVNWSITSATVVDLARGSCVLRASADVDVGRVIAISISGVDGGIRS